MAEGTDWWQEGRIGGRREKGLEVAALPDAGLKGKEGAGGAGRI